MESKKNIYFLIYIIVFTILLIAPSADSITRNSYKEITSGINSNALYSVKDVIKQDIILEGKLQNLSIPVYMPYSGNYGDASVAVTVIQGDYQKRVLIPIKDISGILDLSLKKYDLSKGTATLLLEGVGFSEDTDLYVYKSDMLNTGLATAFRNDISINGPICLTYHIVLFNSIFYYSILLLIFVFFIVIGVSYLFVNIEKFKKKNLFFWLSYLLIFLLISVNNPQTSFYAEPVSEMTYEFWYKAHNMGFFQGLMSLMSGECLVWPERILMYVSDLIAPTKYVFLVAQIFELLLISGSASMLCMDEFDKYLPIEIRFPLSVILGSNVLFAKAYFFWSVSYWVVFFLLFFAFFDMEKMRNVNYYMGLVVTVIFCVSRLYNVVFIPIAFFCFLFQKERGKKFRIYCVVIAAASTFGVIYSLFAGAINHLSTNKGVDIILFINNTLYWYLQVFNSMIFGQIINNQLAVNFCSLVLFIVLLFWMAKLYFSKNKNNMKIASIILCAGIMGAGSVMLNVATSYMSSTVQMAYNYSEKINWSETHYQNADLHFAFAYFSFIIIVCCIGCYIWRNCIANNFSIKKRVMLLSLTSFVLFLCFIRNSTEAELISNMCVDWKNTYYVTENENYYISVNNDYLVAPISLTQNSSAKIIGRDSLGNMYEWNYGDTEYTHTDLYNEADLSNIPELLNDKILALTVKKGLTNFAVAYYANLYDINGNLISSVRQTNDTNRIFADFFFEEPIQGVAKISFTLEEGYPVYVMDALQFGLYND